MKLRYYKSLLEPHLYELQPCLTINHFLFVFLFISTPDLLRPIDHAPIHIFQASSHCYTESQQCNTLQHTFTVVLGAESKHGLLEPRALNSFGQANWMETLHNSIISRWELWTALVRAEKDSFSPKPKEWNAYTKFSLCWTQERTRICSATL